MQAWLYIPYLISRVPEGISVEAFEAARRERTRHYGAVLAEIAAGDVSAAQPMPHDLPERIREAIESRGKI